MLRKASADALTAVLIVWDVFSAVGLILNIRSEILHKKAQPDSPAAESKSTRKPPALRNFLNRSNLLGVLVHIAWCVDPLASRNIYSTNTNAIFLVVEFLIGFTSLSAFFNSWMYVLFRDVGKPQDEAVRFSYLLVAAAYVVPIISLIASAISHGVGDLNATFVSLMIYTISSAIALFSMNAVSTFAAFKAVNVLKQRQENAPRAMLVIRRQLLVIVVYATILVVEIAILALDLVRTVVFDPEAITLELRFVFVIVPAILWSISPAISYSPWFRSAQNQKHGAQETSQKKKFARGDQPPRGKLVSDSKVTSISNAEGTPV